MTSFSIVFEILFLVIIANAQQQPPVSSSELCYLADGSSSLTLTVNEATAVGSVIGIIDVNGNPSLEDGNVDLLDGAPPESRAALMADLASGSASRQNRRLFGRRDTSLAHSAGGVGRREPGATTSTAASSSFYSLVAAGSAVTVTPSSAIASTAAANQQQQHQTQLPSAVRVQPGTKNLILARPLDKESAEGDLSQLVNVRCRPRQSSTTTATEANDSRGRSGLQQLPTTSFTTIPIRLIITDANDHAPEFVGQLPYVINISETTPLNSIVSRDILALDKDSAGPHSTIHYRVLDTDERHHNPAPANHLAGHFAFVNPLEPALSLTSALDYESLPSGSFVLSIVAQDQGEPEPLQSIAQVQVNVLDSDDQNPRFLDEKYTLVMDETQASSVGHNLRILPRNLKAEDGDRGINAPILYSFDSAGSSDSQSIGLARTRPSSSDESRQVDEVASTNIERYLHLNPTSGKVRLIRQWPAGGIGLPLTLVVRACQADNRDRYALTTLTIVRSALATNQISSEATQGAQVSQVSSGPKQGIEFPEQRVAVQVAEDAPVNERIVQVRAHHIQEQQQASQQLESGTTDGSGAAPPHSNKQQQSPSNGPINYQILDDPNEQFEINGLGEIFLRHSLDYEQRQEFRFRVLATYTKYSDICHVQVTVLNVNDHRPKFTQAQYSLHLTESRLRSNSIGHVQAHDADLNDTVQYSILSAVSSDQQQANLFEIGPNGQIGLKPGVRQLNASLFQLLVQARDTLGPVAGQHTQQARVNIHLAPQIISRSLIQNGDQQDQEVSSVQERELVGLAHSRYTLSPQSSLSASSSSSSPSSAEWTTTPTRKTSGRDSAQRLLKEHSNTNDSAHSAIRANLSGAESSTIASYQHQLEAHFNQGKQLQQQQQQRQPNPSNQRSSLATVMASLQHMAKSVNFLEMPISSALLLTVLLTFLVCLLLIVVISMSVHVYRISSRARSRRSQHKRLATAARLRHHAQMAAAASTSSPLSSTSPYNSAASSSSSCASSQAPPPPPQQQQQQQVQTIAQAVQDASRMTKDNRAQNYYDNLAMTESAISSSNKSKQTRANIVDLEAAASQHQRSLSLTGSVSMSDAATDRRTSAVMSPISSSGSSSANAGRPSLASSPSSLLLASSAAAAAAIVAATESGANKHKKVATDNLKLTKSDQANKMKRMRELESKQFKALKISISNETTNIALGETYLCDQPNGSSSKQNPLYLESGTNLSGASAITEPRQPAPLDRSKGPASNKSPASTSISSVTDDDDDNSSAVNCGHYSVNGTMELRSKQNVRLPKVTPPGGDHRNNKCENLGKTISDLVMSGHQCDQSERRSDKSEPTVTIDSYRRLSLMDSLTRPTTRIRDRQQLFGQLMNNKVAPSERASMQLKRPVGEPQYRSSGGGGGGGLMAMVRAEVDPASQRQYQTAAQIKWPSESIPQRIKKLTWDDELSCCDGDTTTSPVETIASSRLRGRAHSRQEDDEGECYISPNVRIGSASGDMEREMHRYRDQSQANQTGGTLASTPQQNRFLFSLSNHTMPSLNLQQQQEHPAQQHRPHDESYQFDVQYLDHLLDDHPSDLTLTSLASGRNQNNCLDYTIVDDSQFLANSLANASNDPVAKATGGQRQSTGESWLDGRHHQFDSAASSQMAPRQQMDSMDDNQSSNNHAMDQQQQQQRQSLTSTGQTHVIFKLNQNYQDLKLMTTAIL